MALLAIAAIVAISACAHATAPTSPGPGDLRASMDDATWDREAGRIRSSPRPASERAEALAQLAVSSGDVERIRAMVREIERTDLPARDKLALQAQLQEQERRLRAGLPVRMPTLSGRATPTHSVPSAEYRGRAPAPRLPGPLLPPTVAPVAPPTVPAPSVNPRPGAITAEDLAGAWTSDGRRLLRQGPLYVDPQTGQRCLPSAGTCILQ